jgi:phenylalanyl-tRNA synthetase beta subunit
MVTVPYERLDLNIEEDLIDEIARVYGLTQIKAQLPPKGTKSKSFFRIYFESKYSGYIY